MQHVGHCRADYALHRSKLLRCALRVFLWHWRKSQTLCNLPNQTEGRRDDPPISILQQRRYGVFDSWQRTENTDDNFEVTCQFDVKEKEWKKYSKIKEDDDSIVKYFFNTEENEWEKIDKFVFDPVSSYAWDKQNEKWKLEENYEVV